MRECFGFLAFQLKSGGAVDVAVDAGVKC